MIRKCIPPRNITTHYGAHLPQKTNHIAHTEWIGRLAEDACSLEASVTLGYGGLVLTATPSLHPDAAYMYIWGNRHPHLDCWSMHYICASGPVG